MAVQVNGFARATMSDVSDEGNLPTEPQLGVPPPISAWTAEARAQTERGRRDACIECFDEASALARNQNPNHSMQGQPHAGRFRGFDVVRAKNAGFYTERGYAELEVTQWKVAVMLVPTSASTEPVWDPNRIMMAVSRVLVPPRRSTRQHMVIALKTLKPLSATNARWMLPLVKTMFSLGHVFAPQPENDMQRASVDPTFALFRAGDQGVAVWPVLTQEGSAEMMNQEFAEVDDDGDPVTCAADPDVFPATGPGGDDLPPLIGFMRGAPVWAQRQGELPGAGTGLPYWLRENMLCMGSATMPRERVREAAALVFSRGAPTALSQGNVTATRRDTPPNENPAPRRGPMCAPMAAASVDAEFCALCITRVMQLQVVLPPVSAVHNGSWADAEICYADLMSALHEDGAGSGARGRTRTRQPSARTRGQGNGSQALMTPGRQRWVQRMEEEGLYGSQQQNAFEAWRRDRQEGNVREFLTDQNGGR